MGGWGDRRGRGKIKDKRIKKKEFACGEIFGKDGREREGWKGLTVLVKGFRFQVPGSGFRVSGCWVLGLNAGYTYIALEKS